MYASVNMFVVYCVRINVKSFPSSMAHWAALISVSLALSQTPAYTARPRIRGYSAVCAPAFAGTHCAYPREGWPGWVDLGGWLRTEMVYLSADGHPSKYWPGPALINFVDLTQPRHAIHGTKPPSTVSVCTHCVQYGIKKRDSDANVASLAPREDGGRKKSSSAGLSADLPAIQGDYRICLLSDHFTCIVVKLTVSVLDRGCRRSTCRHRLSLMKFCTNMYLDNLSKPIERSRSHGFLCVCSLEQGSTVVSVRFEQSVRY